LRKALSRLNIRDVELIHYIVLLRVHIKLTDLLLKIGRWGVACVLLGRTKLLNGGTLLLLFNLLHLHLQFVDLC
jgi:hypothetical protein